MKGKTLILHRHSDKTPNNHISTEGRMKAKQWGKLYDRFLGAESVSHVFFGPLIRTGETAYATISGRFAFDQATIHNPVDGLGSNELFAEMITDEVRRLIKEGNFSNLDAVIAGHNDDELKSYVTMGQQALIEMFDAMQDGELGIGFFHDPTIPLLARSLGLDDARSLDSMEPIAFAMYNNDGLTVITAYWPTCFEK